LGVKDMKFSEGITHYKPQTLTCDAKRQLLEKLKSIKIPLDELLKQYAGGERDFRGVILSEQILIDVDLSRADLSEATLHKTVLEGANLTRTNLSRADLTRANLRGAELIEANLMKANLREANLRGADLSGADLRGADLTGADLGGAILPDGSILLTSQPSNRVISPYARAQS
jgi:uncharacterized protein YjbI with pentapeptide repeats